MTNVEALKALYAALGGDPADVADAVTIVDVLNAIAAKYEGADDATINPDAIANIAAVAENIGGGGDMNAKIVYNSSDDFGNNWIEAIEIPEGATTDDFAYSNFSNSYALKKISIPSTMETIPESFCRQCDLLTDVTIANGVEAIDEYAFESCDVLESIAIPSSVKTIGNSAFENCEKLVNVTLSEGLESIGESAFAYSLPGATITIPSTVTSIASNVFAESISPAKIIINKPEGSLSGAPWGAYETTEVIWNG